MSLLTISQMASDTPQNRALLKSEPDQSGPIMGQVNSVVRKTDRVKVPKMDFGCQIGRSVTGDVTAFYEFNKSIKARFHLCGK